MKHLYSLLTCLVLVTGAAFYASAKPLSQDVNLKDTLLVTKPGNAIPAAKTATLDIPEEKQADSGIAAQEQVQPGNLSGDKPGPAPKGYWVKTNLLAWAFFQANAAAEIELFDHFTLSLPIYYGALNWFTQTIKFHTLEFRPELRWWYKTDCTGPFAAVHGTVGLYNYAFGGELRYQDHNGNTPAWGGGITLGWRLPLKIGSSDNWGLEFALGAAALKLNYDTFYNMKNGNYFQQDLHKVYFGLDNVSVTMTYRFDSKRRFRR